MPLYEEEAYDADDGLEMNPTHGMPLMPASGIGMPGLDLVGVGDTADEQKRREVKRQQYEKVRISLHRSLPLAHCRALPPRVADTFANHAHRALLHMFFAV